MLYKEAYWAKLLHYKKGVLGFRSSVDDPAFFLASDGKTSLQNEMHETLRAYFQPVDGKKLHAGIKFIARYNWLEKNLGIDRSKLPFDFIAEFEKFYKDVNPGKAVFVFPAGYINSPASMYGHTLLVIEPKNGNRLLSISINYAGDTTETFGPIYAFRGLFGLYNGYYSVLPYYQKINEYSSGEMRDMWEYSLNLTDDEIKRIMMHNVELERIASDYYFLDENCSYNLLLLFEIARPGAELAAHFPVTVEPIDTIRVINDAGFVEKKTYRPSLYEQIVRNSSKLTIREVSAVIDYSKGGIDVSEFSSIADKSPQKIRMYDLASDYLKFSGIKGNLSYSDYQNKIVEILKKRSTLNSTDMQAESFSDPALPESSHRSNKISLMGGSYDSEKFLQFEYRPTCHDLIDSDLGLTKNSEMVFGNTAVRYYPEKKKFKFQKFELIKITALPACNMLYTPQSFFTHTGLKQAPFKDKKDYLAGYLDFGGGFSLAPFSFFQFYGMFKADLNFAGKYKYNSFSAFGGTGGIILDAADVWKGIFYGDALKVPWGDKTYLFRFGTIQRIKISSYVQIKGEFKREIVFKNPKNEISGSADCLF